MITFEQAKQIALDTIGPDCALYEDSTLEKPYGWYFSYQSNNYIQSGNFDDMLLGIGGFIVERDDGYVFTFTAAESLEDNLASYEAGFRYDTYDLTILSISDREKTLYLLANIGLSYVIPEEEGGVVWRIPKRYTEEHLREMLVTLPYTFYHQDLTARYKAFSMVIDKIGCCQYRLQGHRQPKS